MASLIADVQSPVPSPAKNKPGVVMLHSTLVGSENIPIRSNRFLGMEDDDLIACYFEPLLAGTFTIDLAWEIVKDMFGPGDTPAPLFLSTIDRMQKNNIIQMKDHISGIKTIEFSNPHLFTTFTTRSVAWDRYYSYWACQTAKLNSQLRSNALVHAFLNYNCFENHYQNLFNKILTFNAQSESDASLRAIGQILGGHISEFCVAILPPPEGCMLTYALMNICNANIGMTYGIAPSSIAHASVAARPTTCSVACRIDHAILLRLNSKLNEACDVLCGAIVHARQLPRMHGSHTLLCNALLQLAHCQHDQLDRMGSDDEMAAAMRENVKCLYEEVTTLCQNMPRGVNLPNEIWLLKGYALSGLACLHAAAEAFEEAHLEFSRALACKKKAVGDSHPLLIDTLLGWSTLEKDEGNLDNARRLVLDASEIIKALNTEVGEYTAAYSIFTARCMNNLALLYDDEDQFDDAVESYIAAQTLYSEIMGPHCMAVADISMNLGSLFTSLGAHEDAMRSFQLALTIYRKQFGINHADTIGAQRNVEESKNAMEMDKPMHSGKDAGPNNKRHLINDSKVQQGTMGCDVPVTSPGKVNQDQNDSITEMDDIRPATNTTSIPIDSSKKNYSHPFVDDMPENGLTALEQSISNRHFPRNVEFLMVQAELMWASECFDESRATYEEALLKCREEERSAVEAIKAHNAFVKRTTSNARAKSRSRMGPGDHQHGSESESDDDEEEEDHTDREIGSSYVINRASLYIAEILLCLGDLLNDMRGSGCADDSADKAIFDKEAQVVVRSYEEALAIFRITLGEQDIRVADTLCKLGSHFANESQYQHAEELFYEAQTLYRLWWKTDRAKDVLEVKHLLARCLQGKGLHEKALELCQEVVTISEKLHEKDPSHTDIANAFNTHGSLLQEQNKLENALVCYTRALEMYKVVFGDEVEGKYCHPLVARAYNNMGSLFDDMGNFHEAKRMYEESLSILSEVHRDGHPQIAITVSNLASLLNAEGLVEDAKPLYELALSIYRKSYGDNHVTVKDTLMLLDTLNKKSSGQASDSCIII